MSVERVKGIEPSS